jgi:uncharacterized protein
MAGCLLDVNVLIALMWPAHEGHQRAQHWFRQHAVEGWATCPLTEAAFVRIVSNPAFSSDAPEPREAVDILGANLKHPHHRFWPDDVGFVKAVQPFAKKLAGHKQVTDAYLLGLALHKKGKLVSLDRGILDLLPEKSRERELVIVL